MCEMKNNQILYLIILLIFFLSCVNSKEDKILFLIKSWENKEVLFPKKNVFTLHGKDTIDFSMQSQYKIFVYVDSVGCLSCKLRLPQWQEFIDTISSLELSSVKFLFFFSPEKKSDICNATYLANFKYPICIDERDSVNKLNHFPSNMAFQTFLLDKNNKVVAIGNPVHNPKIKELYLNIIQGKKDVEGEKTLRTEITIKEPIISLGHFNWKEEKKTAFKIENTGKYPLIINDVTTSCGCTSVDYSKEPVRPGDSISLQVTYKADHPEHFDKTITVYCNANPSLVHLKIMGDAE